MVFLRRPKKPLAARSTFLCLACAVTPRLTRDIIDLLRSSAKGTTERSAIGQEVFPDVLAVGLEQHLGAAQVADLLVGPLDHAVALAALGVDHFAGSSDLEALLGARLGLYLGHLALLGACGPSCNPQAFPARSRRDERKEPPR